MRDYSADLILTIMLAGFLVLGLWLRVQVHMRRARRRVDRNEDRMEASRRWLGD